MRHIGYIIVLLLVAVSCRTNKTAQSEYIYIHDRDTVTVVNVRLDSIVVKDSVLTYEKGDTIYKERYHSVFKERIRVDTVTKIITKNYHYTKTEIKEVEVNVLKRWQKTLIWIGGIASALIILHLALKLFRRFK